VVILGGLMAHSALVANQRQKLIKSTLVAAARRAAVGDLRLKPLRDGDMAHRSADQPPDG